MRFRPILSPVPGIQVWGAKGKGYNFVITYEDGTRLRPEDHAEWKGFTASYNIAGKTTRIDGLWQSFTAAEDACKAVLRQLHRPN